jgi:hypothetical protein
MAKKKKKSATQSDMETEVLSGDKEWVAHDFDSKAEFEAPTESEPVEAEPKKSKSKSKPKPLRPEGCSFEVFTQVGGFKRDRLAGFRSYAKRMGLGPMSIKEWRVEYEKFMRLPV